MLPWRKGLGKPGENLKNEAFPAHWIISLKRIPSLPAVYDFSIIYK